MPWRNSRLVLALLVIAVAAAVISLIAGWRELVIEPAAMVLWLAWRVLASVPQSVYWTLIILLAALPLFRLVGIRRGEDYISAYRPEDLPPSRVNFWRTTIRDASLSNRDRRLLENALEDLSAEVDPSLRDSQQSEIGGSNDRIRTHRPGGVFGRTDLADRGDFRIDGPTLPIPPPNPLRPLLRRLFQPDYEDIDGFLQLMEKEMDIVDDIDSN